ncbi:MAG: site-specific DNA-methyltransferase, partial [Chloroflexi bacterium]
MTDPNLLYYGDNLEVLRDHVTKESVDLVYLDPPFNSNTAYNVFFPEKGGMQSAAQIQVFEDTWVWTDKAEQAYKELVTLGDQVSLAMLGFRTLLKERNLMAYLAMMAPRLVMLRSVLKSTGSIYLHCDPTASHYLKVLMDAIFGPENFRSEIVWRRTGAHGKTRRYGPIHDTILFYTKSTSYRWNSPTRPYMRGHVEEYFVHDEKGWRTAYYGNVLTGSGLRGGESGKPWHGFDPSAKGRHWAIPGGLIEDLEEDVAGLGQHQKLDLLLAHGHIKITPGQAWPMYERYLKPSDGMPVPDIWAFQPYTEGTVFGTNEGIDKDVRWLSPKDQERLSYPTQKPLALLQRILAASSNPGDIVLDPFCGCGTTIDAAQRMGRRWIGIDITHLAVSLIKKRLLDAYGEGVAKTYRVIGEPKDLESAKALAAQDKYQFQYWVIGEVLGWPVEQKKGADKGIDGRVYFFDEASSSKSKQVIISVKGGHTGVQDIRDLRGVLDREKAQIG